MRVTIVPVLAVVFATGSVATAQAQVQVRFGSSAPRFEFGAHISLLDLMSDATRTRGGRVAKRCADWLVGELAYDKTSWRFEDRDSRLLTAGMRVQAPSLDRGRRPFVLLGVARAGGVSFDWSPIVAPGIQHELPSGVAMLRIEIQLFMRGSTQPPTYDRARFLIGCAVGIP